MPSLDFLAPLTSLTRLELLMVDAPDTAILARLPWLTRVMIGGSTLRWARAG